MSVSMQPGPYEAAQRQQAIEARRRLFGNPKPPEPRPPRVEDIVTPAIISRAALPHAKLIRRKPVTRAAPPKIERYRSKYWTPERAELLVKMWADGATASTIAEALGGGITRSAVCGKIWRIEHPDGKAAPRKKSPRTNVHKKANKTTRSNVTKDALPAPKATRAVVVALPVRGVSDADLVRGWLAQNGGPRKFKRGDTADPLGIKFWLRPRGYEMSFTQKGGMAVKRVGAEGKPRAVTLKQLIAFVDTLRAAEGLEAIAR